MDIVVLGSGGGPQPNPARSAPAVAIVHGDHWFAVDAGNGIARQAVRAGLELRRLRGIFITHHHIDHAADLGNLAHLAWTAGLSTPIVVMGPPPIRAMVEEHLHLNRVDIAHREHLGRPILRDLLTVREVTDDGTCYEEDGLVVRAAAVEHPPLDAVGFRFDAGEESAVISGDTTYTPAMVELARGAGALVHEAYSPAHLHLLTDGSNAAVDRLQLHFARAHTSCADAGRVAAEAGVARLVLWHLIPTTGVDAEVFRAEAAEAFTGEIIASEDLQRISASTAPRSPGGAL